VISESERSRHALVLGGARSGKSRFAESLITATPAPWNYIATGQAVDDEMRARIQEHQNRRAEGWRTVEAPLALAGALADSGERPVLIDCLTLWLTNLLLGDHDIPRAIAALETACRQRRALTVLVANEVGLGIVPDNVLARRFRDEAGLLNQKIAALADQVWFVAAGLPLKLKG
jgi:adenosyl cobinamide kinase/adenosyl cobinamide phosphate guanylyltransferase